MKDILFLEPVLKEMIWGGSRLKSDFGYDIPSDHTGECWAVSAHANGDCTVKNGLFKGEKLSSLWKNHPELFGNVRGDVFPLLVKIIDAKNDLSIQVHPDDRYAAEHENGALGKTECWYILDCDPDGKIVIGHNAKDKTELKDMIDNQKWNDLIRVLPIKKGDFFQIEPGTVHAIKTGTLILETQQSSDITYRLYDYDRLSDGKPRELHINKCIDVITCPHEEVIADRNIIEFENATVEHLISCDYYTVSKLWVNGSQSFKQKEPFTILSVVEGEGNIDGTPIVKGDHFILPAGYGEYTMEGEVVVIKTV
ncbi:MAG: mannose-6-phosphate isomerase, class [Anaerocolumna sp.]|nr:mannose-6-phosphate isomerase, class [Anaerocolumna sp.]